jgi:hypothetical protein
VIVMKSSGEGWKFVGCFDRDSKRAQARENERPELLK